MAQSIAAFEHDITNGRWQDPVASAAAIVIGAAEFVTFDTRQAAVAKKGGLTVKPWRRCAEFRSAVQPSHILNSRRAT
jgi:hypothetical protein